MSTRRTFLGAAAVATVSGATAVRAVPVAHPDGAFIALCAEHAVNVAAFNRDGGSVEPEHDPLWAAYDRTRDAISAAKPHTIEGVMAKARAAKADAGRSGDGGYPEGCAAADWAWDIVGDLLRLHGRA